MGRRTRAVRGATTVTHDAADQIVEATAELVREILNRNDLAHDDVISVIFTLTEDLVSEFPAVAARQLGMSAVPLLCAREIPVPGSLERCIRALMHCEMPEEAPVRHVYLRDARRLRLDLVEETPDETA